MNIHQKIYAVIFTYSLILFLISFLIQYPFIFSYSNYYGILFKMDLIFWEGYVAVLIMIYFHLINFKKFDEKYVYLSLLILIIYLIGTPFFYEYLPRFEDAWSHSFLGQEMLSIFKSVLADFPRM